MLLSILLFLGTEDVILIAAVVLLLFGGKKIPELMKGLGKGVKSFKDGIEGLKTISRPTINSNLQKNLKKINLLKIRLIKVLL